MGALARAFLGRGSPEDRGVLLDLQVALLLALLPAIQLWAVVSRDDFGPLSGPGAALWLGAFLVASLAHVVAFGLVVAALARLAWSRWRGAPAGRRDRLAWAALGVAGVMAAPFLAELGRGPLEGERALRVATANVLSRKGPHPDAVRELVGLDADVLVVTEFHHNWKAALAEPLGRSHPHQVLRSRDDAFGLGIYSRVPLGAPVELAGMPWGIPLLRIPVELPGGPVALYAIHTMPPRTPTYVHEHRAMVRAFLGQVEPGPAVLVGDFNFGVHTPQHRALGRLGFRDALSDGARGHHATWPVLGWTRALPGMRLDHVYARGFTCIAAGTGHGYSTDHRPVWADLAR